MQVFNYSKQPNKNTFGWKDINHVAMSVDIVARCNNLLPNDLKINTLILKDSCVAPDKLKEHVDRSIGYYGHIVDIDNLKSNPPDAYHLALNYTKKALEANKIKDFIQRDEFLGQALHFIQDSLCPVHNINVSLKDRFNHMAFEENAKKMDVSIYKNISEDTIVSFKERFLEAIRKAKNYDTKVKKNEYFNNSVIQSLRNTYNVSDLYVKGMVVKFQQDVWDFS